MTQYLINAPSPRGTNYAGLMLPADRFPGLDNPVAAYDAVNGLGAAKRDPRIQKVLDFLSARLTTQELMAVEKLLMQQAPAPAAPQSVGVTPDVAEDARYRNASPAQRAQMAFDRRYPDAARIEILAPARTPTSTASDAESFFSRYPDARRIGHV